MDAKRSLLLLNEVTQLFRQYLKFFQPVCPAAERLGQQLLSLKDGVQKFTRRYNEASKICDVYRRLTVDLHNTLSTLRFALKSCSRQFATGSLTGDDWYLALDSLWMEHHVDKLSPLSTIVEIINEAMELIDVQTQGSEVRATEDIPHSQRSQKEVSDSSLHLQTLTGYFFHGITSSTRIGYKDRSDVFTSSNIAHRDIGQRLATQFRWKTREAERAKSQDEDLWTWKIRHSIYWLCKSSKDMDIWKAKKGVALEYNSLPAHDKNEVASMFTNALKAAWLANELGLHLDELEVQNIISLTKEKVLKHMNTFYENPFTTPNYDLINELGNFDIEMAEWQKPQLEQEMNGVGSLPSPASSEIQVQRPAELEALTPAPSSELFPHESLVHTVPGHLHVTTSIPTRSAFEDLLTIRLSLNDGLHITQAEERGLDQGIDHMPARLQEIELHNEEVEPTAEGRSGFTYGVSTIDPNPPLNTTYIQSRVRVFRLDSQMDSYLTLNTYRDSFPKDRRVIKPSTAQLVPEYAFTDNRSNKCEIYVRDSGMQNSLRYKFHCRKDDEEFYPWELYGFQGALMGAQFEGDYSVKEVKLHRKGSQRTECERSSRIQVWTDFPTGHNATNSKASSSTLAPVSMDRRQFSALSEQSADVNDSKMFIFSQNFIYLFFISNRISLIRPRRSSILSKKTQGGSCVRLVPSKQYGGSAIRVRTLKGTHALPAGIPLGGSGMQHKDQMCDEFFEDFQSIEIDFDSEKDASEFTAHFKEYMENWQHRRPSVDPARTLERERRIAVSSETVELMSRTKRRRGSHS